MSSREGKNKKHKKDSDSDSSSEEEYKKSKTHKKKKHKRRRSPSNSSDSEHRKKKHKSERDKKYKKKKKKDKRKKSSPETVVGPEVPEELLSKGRNMTPMTKEEWEKQQSVVKRVYDPETGRHRLIKGTGEILEEIVSKDMHKEINKQATLGDGNYFQSKLTNLR